MKEIITIKEEIFEKQINFKDIFFTAGKIRLSITILLSIIYICLQILSGFHLPVMPAIIIFIIQLFINQPNRIIKRSIKNYKMFFHISLFLDILAISILIYISGGILSFFSILYIFPIIFCGLRISLKTSIIIAATSGFFYILIFFFDIILQNRFSMYQDNADLYIMSLIFSINISFMFVTAFFSNYLMDHFRIIISNARETLENQSGLNRIAFSSILKNNKNDILLYLFNEIKNLYLGFFLSFLIFDKEKNTLIEDFKQLTHKNLFSGKDFTIEVKRVLKLKRTSKVIDAIKTGKILELKSLKEVYPKSDHKRVSKFEKFHKTFFYYFFPVKSEGMEYAKKSFLLGFKNKLHKIDQQQISMLLTTIAFTDYHLQIMEMLKIKSNRELKRRFLAQQAIKIIFDFILNSNNINNVLSSIAMLTLAKSALYFKYDNHNQFLLPVLKYNISNNFKTIAIKIGEGYLGKIAKEMTPEIITTERKENEFIEIYTEFIDIKNLLVCPVIRSNKLYGMISLFNKEYLEFNKNDMEMVKSIAPIFTKFHHYKIDSSVPAKKVM